MHNLLCILYILGYHYNFMPYKSTINYCGKFNPMAVKDIVVSSDHKSGMYGYAYTPIIIIDEL